jgi:hypothetical protein
LERQVDEKEQFTEEQREFLASFADHYRAGRHFLCFFAHLVAMLGALGGAVTAYFALRGRG